jgi:hypothetical protein
MTGKLKDLTFGAKGEQHVTVTVREDFRAAYDTLRECDVDVTIKKLRKKRSLDANAYAWILIDKIAAVLGASRVSVYRDAIRDIGGVSETVCVVENAADKLRRGWEHGGLGWQTETMPSKLDGCVNVILYYGSSTYDSKQMSALIERLIDEAKTLGIETATPEQIARYTQEWGQE